ncbi:hypothetical protein Pmani_038047 [Petrolisthes manimaculis]|uniref:Uncharacterized protein n=1 Tax=Petrolisthes manimaculis TaxID=1843537 RepID=A0AAE1NGZ3_9EUCA|nr:hypothetical protein Pmani_038047 [Petrolisthes manimaculis]
MEEEEEKEEKKKKEEKEEKEEKKLIKAAPEYQGRNTDSGKGALCSGVHQEGKRNHTTASCRRQAGSTGSERQIGA